MLEKLSAIYDRFMYLEEQLSDPGVTNDMARFSRTNKDYKEIQPMAQAYLELKSIMEQTQSAQEALNDPDEEMREMAREEIQSLKAQNEELEAKIREMLMPKDPDDNKDVLFEIRSGTGGDEAAIFAGDLFRMYTRYFDTMGWKWEVLAETEGDHGGYSKLEMEVHGEEVYGKMKFESGAHRVQRVPETEAKGRVHTSAATVAVIPILEPEDVNINKADLKIDVYRASGAGGQHVNRTESAVRITHLPTGTIAESQEARSQIKNREIAMNKLINRIQEATKKREESELASQRRSLVGTGDRSEKIRTYNFPQNRMTDHRIDLTLYSLDRVIMGDMGGIVEALVMAERAELMKGQEVE
jgi:peptide chain release factor 1